MSKLERKCFTGAFLAHGLLVFVLIFGAAFLGHREPEETMPTVFNYTQLTDAQVTPGNPKIDAPPVTGPITAVQPQQSQPRTETPVQPPPANPPEKPADKKVIERPPDHVKVAKKEPVKHKDSSNDEADGEEKPASKIKPSVPLAHDKGGKYREDDRKKKATDAKKTASAAGTPVPHVKPTVDLDHVVTRTNETAATEAAARDAARRAEDDRRRASALAGIIGQAISAVTTQGNTTTEISLSGGGSEFANYSSLIFSVYKRRYDDELSRQGDFATSDASVMVSITLSRDGKVTDHRIVTPSGNSTLDGIVRRVLRNVDHIAPFPPETKDTERTFKIVFDLKTTRQI